MSVRIIGVVTEIQTCHLPNTNQNCYHLDLLGRKHRRSSEDFSFSVGRHTGVAITSLFRNNIPPMILDNSTKALSNQPAQP